MANGTLLVTDGIMYGILLMTDWTQLVTAEILLVTGGVLLATDGTLLVTVETLLVNDGTRDTIGD